MLLKCIHMALLSSSSSSSSVNLLLFSPSLTPSVHPLSTTVLLRQRRFSCRAASPGPPPAPGTDPPPGNDSGMLRDLAASLSKIQDRAQIFFAVLFWVSLFFWASAWDGRNRPNK
ncbi:uncharacterized protein LOC107472687 isoform X2 [Arachis duranensis]|uniref:Uncharacterized protein LOC107472687 isoform X2 n=1 Tax=Arachis duranensis TaxID=130453 RepID=A0A6P4BTL1_ARADU|nr:uncharacterized protein LOC107472687 isoform X2 [Arachis duranensis]